MSTEVTLPIEYDEITVDGRSRSFTVLGARQGPPLRRLVVVLHGSRQSGAGFRRFTGRSLDDLAVRDDAVVAYLDGYRGRWNDARRANTTPTRRQGVDDVAFLRGVVDWIAASHGIDPRSVTLVGYSNGGQLALRALHESPDLVAAAVVVAAAMPAPENVLRPDVVPPARAVPVTLVHGTRDRIAPFEGGTGSRWIRTLLGVGGRMLSAPDTAAYLADRNGITVPPVRRPVPAHGGGPADTLVESIEYVQEGLPPVVLQVIYGGGHTVPGLRPAPRVLGRTSRDIALVDLVREAMRAGRPRRGTAR